MEIINRLSSCCGFSFFFDWELINTLKIVLELLIVDVEFLNLSNLLNVLKLFEIFNLFFYQVYVPLCVFEFIIV